MEELEPRAYAAGEVDRAQRVVVEARVVGVRQFSRNLIFLDLLTLGEPATQATEATTGGGAASQLQCVVNRKICTAPTGQDLCDGLRAGFSGSPRESSCDESGAARLDPASDGMYTTGRPTHESPVGQGDFSGEAKNTTWIVRWSCSPSRSSWRCRHRSSRPRAPVLRCSSPGPNC